MNDLEMTIVSPYDRQNLVCEIVCSNKSGGFLVEISCETGRSIDMQFFFPKNRDQQPIKINAVEFSKLLQKGIQEMSIYLDKADHADARE